MSLAVHLLADFYGVPVELDDDLEILEAALVDAARAAGCTVEGIVRKKFEPQGASVLVLVSESHLSLHSWPEHGYVAIDIFTCGEALREQAVELLRERLRPERVELRVEARGPPLAAHGESRAVVPHGAITEC